MKYAVIKSGGRQYRVSEGDVVEVDRLNVKQDQGFSFDDVLLYVSENTFKLGKPKVLGAVVKGKVLGEKRGEKIRVSKFKAKARYSRVLGHRSYLTSVKIEKILVNSEEREASKRR